MKWERNELVFLVVLFALATSLSIGLYLRTGDVEWVVIGVACLSGFVTAVIKARRS